MSKDQITKEKNKDEIVYVGEGTKIGNWYSSQHKKGCRAFATGLPACGCGCDCGLEHITKEKLDKQRSV